MFTEGGAGTSHEIQIHLPGLIKILGETLYSEPEVSVREMIQNAHDSCLRRMAEDDGFKNPRIDIEANAYARTLTFRDNGSGMTESEIHEFLSTVGKGYTSELRKALAEKNREIAERLIGQFGLGLLSAFIVAEKIQIVTRSYKPRSRGYRWECDGNVTYTLAAADKKDVGTEVVITVSPKHVETMLSEEVLAGVVKTYADFLSLPIYLNQARMPVNVMDAPWHRHATRAEYMQYVRDRYEDTPPLEVIPLEYDEGDLSVHGVLYIPRHTMVSIKEYGDVDIYISRMFICSGDQELLPVWAKFVRGIVDSSSLTPTLSRESVRKDEKYHRVRDVLAQSILKHLDRLASDDPQQLREVVTSHNTLIKAWSLEDDGFFDKICDLVLVDTEYGKMNIPAYLQRFGESEPRALAGAEDEKVAAEGQAPQKTIHYFSDIGSGTQQKILFREAGLCVIDASYGAEQAFLQKYDERHDDIDVKKLDAAAGYIFEPVEDDDGRWSRLEEDFALKNMVARVMKFRPTDIPAILLRVEEDSEHENTVRKLAEDEEVNPELRKFFTQLLQERERYRKGSLTGGTVLHLNAANAIIQQLGASDRADPIRDLAMTLLYNNAVLFESHSVTPENAQVMFRGTNMAIEQLMAKHSSLQEIEGELSRKRLEHEEALEKQRQYAKQQEEKSKSAAAETEDTRKQLAELEKQLGKKAQQVTALEKQRQSDLEESKKQIEEMENQQGGLRASNAALEAELAELREKPAGMPGFFASIDCRPDHVFVMRPFTPNTRWIYDECIKPACDTHGLTPILLEDEVYAGSIFDEIIRHIRECGILIADVTDSNPNVMYEVGAAHILGKNDQTILLAKDARKLPFDISQFKVFSYGEEKELAGLRGRIEKALETIVAARKRR